MALSFVIIAVGDIKESNTYFHDIEKSVINIGGDVSYTRVALSDENIIKRHIISSIDNNEGNVIVVTGGFSEKSVISEATEETIKYEDIFLNSESSEQIATMISCLKELLSTIVNEPICGIRNRTLIISMSGLSAQVATCLEQTGDVILQVICLIAESERMQECESFSESIPRAQLMDIENAILYYMNSSSSLINVKEAQMIIREVVKNSSAPIETEVINANNAYGRIPFDDIHSKNDVPSFRTAIKHGYAVLASDGRGTRKVLKIKNKSIPFTLESGTCIWVRTGAPIPDGATAVVQVANTRSIREEHDIDTTDDTKNNNKNTEIKTENNNDDNDDDDDDDFFYNFFYDTDDNEDDNDDNENTNNNTNNNSPDNTENNNNNKNNKTDIKMEKEEEEEIEMTEPEERENIRPNNKTDIIKMEEKEEEEIEIMTEPEERENIRPIGCEIGTGDKIIDKYTRIGVAEMGLLASGGIARIKVVKLPSIGLMSIGDNLEEPGDSLRPYHTYDSNRITLISLLNKNGFDCTNFGIVAYDIRAIVERIKKVIEDVDVLVTTGCANDKDVLKPILTEYFKAIIHFGGVNMKPGKSTTFATFMFNGIEKYILCFSANPISVPIVAHLFLLPLINELRCYFNMPTASIPAHIQTRYDLHSRPRYTWTNLQFEEFGTTARAFSMLGKSNLINYELSNALLKLPSSTSKLRAIFGKFLPVEYIGYK